MNLVREQSDRLQFDFIVEKLGGGYEEEAKSYGCRFHHETPPGPLGKRLRILGLLRESPFLERVLAAHQYDVLHIHGEEFMGDAAKIGAVTRVPARIVHCHNTVLARGKKTPEMLIRRLRFLTLDRSRILRYATDIAACSSDAGKFLLGRRWKSDPRCRPLYCGVPLATIHTAAIESTRATVRSAHEIPSDARVIGHAGSMGPTQAKNHGFIVEVFAELARRDPRWFLFLAGDGPLRPSITEAIRARGLQSRVAMPGLCRDVPALMVHGFDVHLLPSLTEGLPVVGLEAVAAGLFTVCSDTITRDFTSAFPGRVEAVSLAAPPPAWADRLETALPKRITPNEGLALLEKGPFSIQASLEAVIHLYEERLQAPERARKAPERGR